MQNPTTPIASPMVASCRGEVVDGAAHVASGAIGRHALHELAGLVHLVVRRERAVVQVGREGDEAGRTQAVGDPLDVVVETPPLLDHDDTRP